MGWASACAGVSVFVFIMVPFQIWCMKKLVTVRRKTSANSAERIKLISQIFKGISTVKSYCWENPFFRQSV
eukprot:UN29069